MTFAVTITASPYNAVANGNIGGGGTDNTPAFALFNTNAMAYQSAHPGEQTILTIPAGVYDVLGPFTNRSWEFGIKDLVVLGTGATLINSGAGTAGGMALGGSFFRNQDTEDLTGTARVQSVSAGSNSVTLITFADNTKYSPGALCLLMGFWVQQDSNPPNNVFFEWLRVDHVDTTGGGGTIARVYFTTNLKNSYESTWPRGFWPGSLDKPNQGGPATLISADPSFDVSIQHVGLTFGIGSTVNMYIPCNARDMIWTNCTWTGRANGGFAPSISINNTLNNCTQTFGPMEVDKCIETLTFNGGSYPHSIQVASSCINLMHLTGGVNMAEVIGTTNKTIIDGGTQIGTFYLGCSNFGRTLEVDISDSNIDNWKVAGSVISNVDTSMPLSPGGIITRPKSLQTGAYVWPVPWATPGVRCMLGKKGNPLFAVFPEGFPFTVLDVTEDATNFYVQTDLVSGTWTPGANGYPSVPPDVGDGIDIWNHPCPKLTVINSTGSDGTSADLSQAAAVGKPAFSYSKRPFNSPTLLPLYSGQALVVAPIFGTVKSIKVNVTKAYSGIHSPLTMPVLGPYGGQFVDTNGAPQTINPIINLSVPGERDILPGPPIGAQSGDSISALGTVWLVNGYTPTVSSDFSSESSTVWPSLTIEIITDHGIPQPTSFGISKRLRIS